MSGAGRLGLGTAQWGLPYGVSNRFGMTSPEVVGEILSEAACAGVSILDTASLYGAAEAVLGTQCLQPFRIVSKTPKFADSRITDEHAVGLVECLARSLQLLSCQRIYGLLAHHADDLLSPGGEKLVAAMRGLKDKGLVDKIGVSVYDGAQVDELLKQFIPDIVQLPVNALDQRMLVGGQMERLKELGVEIHARSVFLQGLLLMPLGDVPEYFDPIRPLLADWQAAANAQGLTQVQAALSFVRGIPYVDTILVGVESRAQFLSCLKDFSLQGRFDASGLACHDPKFANPVNWSAKK